MEPGKPHQLDYATPPAVAAATPAQITSRVVAAGALGIGFVLLLEGISILGEATDVQAAVMILCGASFMIAAMWYGKIAYRQSEPRYGAITEPDTLREGPSS